MLYLQRILTYICVIHLQNRNQEMSMSINEELLTYILDYYPDWGSSPEKFREFIFITISLSRLMGEMDGSANLGLIGTEEELGLIFIEEFKVDLSPYNDFRDLKEKIKPTVNIAKVLEHMRTQSKEHEEYYDMLDAEQILPSQETVEDEVFADLRTKAIIERLRSRIHFR